MLTKVANKTYRSFVVCGMAALTVPSVYVKCRGLEKGAPLYAHVKKLGDNMAFCFSEFNPSQGAGVNSEIRRLQLSGRQYRVHIPASFFATVNHSPGDMYDVYHDGEGTLIYERISQ